MGSVWNKFVDQVNSADRTARTFKARSADRRPLTGQDIAGFEDAVLQRRPPRNIDQVRERIRLKNPIRFGRLQGDLRWLQKQCRKEGLNPEDARWLL